jgi:hypothetical protein
MAYLASDPVASSPVNREFNQPHYKPCKYVVIGPSNLLLLGLFSYLRFNVQSKCID